MAKMLKEKLERAHRTVDPRALNPKEKEGDTKASPKTTGSPMRVRESNTPTHKVQEKGMAPPNPHGGNLKRLPHRASSSSKKHRSRPAPNRRPDNSDPSLIPCSNCMALLGTNSDCMDCQNSDNLQWVRSNSLFQDLQLSQQRVIRGFPCPLHKDNGDCCTANDDIYGTGDCAGCIAYRAWIHRYYGPTQAGHNPTPTVIMLGYERAILDAFVEDLNTFLKELIEYSNKLSKYSPYPSDLIDWFNSILYPPQR